MIDLTYREKSKELGFHGICHLHEPLRWDGLQGRSEEAKVLGRSPHGPCTLTHDHHRNIKVFFADAVVVFTQHVLIADISRRSSRHGSEIKDLPARRQLGEATAYPLYMLSDHGLLRCYFGFGKEGGQRLAASLMGIMFDGENGGIGRSHGISRKCIFIVDTFLTVESIKERRIADMELKRADADDGACLNRKISYASQHCFGVAVRSHFTIFPMQVRNLERVLAVLNEVVIALVQTRYSGQPRPWKSSKWMEI